MLKSAPKPAGSGTPMPGSSGRRSLGQRGDSFHAAGAAPPAAFAGSDGYAGYDQRATDAGRFDPVEAQRLARKYAVAVGKMLAGVCRFVFEDILQCFCQAVWLCKQWKYATLHAKTFTMASIASGLFLSFAVPLREYREIRAIRGRAETGAGDSLKLTATGADDAGEQDGDDKLDKVKAAKLTSSIPELGEALQQIRGGKPVLKQAPYPADVTVAAFLAGKAGHGHKAHRAMVASALLFWSYMVAYPKLFNDQITCAGSTPATGLQIFFGLFIFDVVLQIWVLAHTQNGYGMLINNLFGFAEGVFFSLIGRFDTYSDVSFTYKLLQCEPITWFSIDDHVFNLPFPLVYFAIFALLVGIFCMQAIPGLFFLCFKWRLPMAMKFNEFNLVLSVMAVESADEQPQE